MPEKSQGSIVNIYFIAVTEQIPSRFINFWMEVI